MTFCDAQVAQHQAPISQQEHVLSFKVSVQDVVFVHEVEAECHLHKPMQYLSFMEQLAAVALDTFV